ncbi:hypothetical protein Leryth_001887 [Lithospermum erythrorhizon]|uniref:Uncharacterized protein n=1 Tax=Lithospermum erythrorhizon TaxID=34254 RepID=A0AAV3Q1Q4_LITER|nr:hypothetical protein Leryth_001887 [Lithospermum erythrorhizon]
MKGVKDEEKHFDPLFPRINISAAERGGPRAPPRNKMALCDQLTIPSSHRFNNGSMSMLPLPPPSTSSNLTASSTPSHVDCHKGLFSPFSSGNVPGVPPGYHDLGVRRHHHSSNGVTISAVRGSEFRSLVSMSYQTAIHWPPTTKHSMSQSHCFLNSRNSTAGKNREQVNNVRLSSYVQLVRSASDSNTRDTMEKHDRHLSCTNSSGKLQTAAEQKLNLTSPLSPITENHLEKSSFLQLSNENMCRDTDAVLVNNKSAKLNMSTLKLEYTQKNEEIYSSGPQTQETQLKRPAYILPTRLKILPDATSGPLSSHRNAKLSANADQSISHKSNSLLDDENRFSKPSIHVHHNYKSLEENKESTESVPTCSETIVRKRRASVMEGPSRSMEELGYQQKSPTRCISINECHKDSGCGSKPEGIIDKSDSTSDETVVKSITNFVVSPEEVVRAIGQERFWKARRTILHQQRVLAAQLFDLHRLVKVQRLMAESPDILFEDNFYLSKSSIKLPNSRKLFAENGKDYKANLQESDFKIEHMPESANRKPQTPNADNGIFTRQPPIPCPRGLVVPPITTDTQSSPLLFHPPPGNQWLVPVRSPSEGLIYKAYTGPLPPTAGILSPVYDNVAPISLTGMGDQSFLNSCYSLPPSNLQGIGNLLGHSSQGQSYLQPYPMPVINGSGSTSTFEPISKFTKHLIADQDSCVPIGNIQTHGNGIVSECSKHLEGCKENDLQDSTVTSPLVKNKVDTLSLFPTTPSHHPPLCSSTTEHKIEVIKVVPHNRKSASESAARIFQTIQEERQKHG